MTNSLFAIMLLVLLLESYAMHTKIHPTENFCLYKNVNEGEKLNINYVSSGHDEHKMILQVFDPEGKTIKEILKQREGNVEITASATGSYRMCWKIMDNYPKTLSFDLSIGDKTEKQAGSANNIDQVSQDVRTAYKMLEKIFRNQHYQHTREEVHRKEIETLESKIQWSAFIKIFILILIAVVQVYILTGYFKSRKEFSV